MTRIRFGTDGWRAVLADVFTFSNVGRAVAGAADVWYRDAGRGATVLVGYDTRFLGERFAATAAGVLAGAGLNARLCPHPLPTPALSWAVREHGAAGGVMVTASHNPPEWNGIKLKGPHGGPVDASFTRRVERAVPAADPPQAPPGEPFDPLSGYLARLAEISSAGAGGMCGMCAVADPMHGAAAGALAGALRSAGVSVTEIRARPDPTFGGCRPEPIEANLGPLRRAVVRAERPTFGIATDGDGDRIGAVDEDGAFVDAQRIFALLLRHLARARGCRGVVAKTYAVTDMVDELAASHGLPLRVLPIGYKHVAEVALREPLLIGGEEAGGIGVGEHLPERDGILCALLLVEAVASHGGGLRGLVADLLGELGPHVYGRVDLPLAADARGTPAAVDLPARLGGLPVRAAERLDGLKVRLGDRGWVLWRRSGTEPLLRVYAETEDAACLRRVLHEASELALDGTG